MLTKNAKDETRKILSAKRKAAKAKHTNASTQIITQFLASQMLKNKNWKKIIVAGYIPIASEINIIPLLNELQKKGAQILMPAIIAKNTPLEWRAWDENTKLINESFGTKTPPPQDIKYLPDVILAPLLGFDSQAYRIGYGGGFYDRSIQAISQIKPIITIGCAYDEQKLDNLPKEPHDIRLNAIVTPTQFLVGKPALER